MGRVCSKDHAGQYSSQDDLHLVNCERRTQAAARAAAEGEEGVRVHAGVDEPFRLERLGLRPDVGPPMGQVEAGCHPAARWQVQVTDAGWRFEIA